MGPKGCIHTHNETKLETALGFNNHCIHCAELYTEETVRKWRWRGESRLSPKLWPLSHGPRCWPCAPVLTLCPCAKVLSIPKWGKCPLLSLGHHRLIKKTNSPQEKNTWEEMIIIQVPPHTAFRGIQTLLPLRSFPSIFISLFIQKTFIKQIVETWINSTHTCIVFLDSLPVPPVLAVCLLPLTSSWPTFSPSAFLQQIACSQVYTLL